MTVGLGIIEGHYGRPWSWAARAAQVSALKPHGYGFYTYAPKADAFLRRRFGGFDHEGAREVLAWLDGDYVITRAMMDDS